MCPVCPLLLYSTMGLNLWIPESDNTNQIPCCFKCLNPLLDNEYKVLLAAEGAVPNDIHIHWVPCEYWIAGWMGLKIHPSQVSLNAVLALGREFWNLHISTCRQTHGIRRSLSKCIMSIAAGILIPPPAVSCFWSSKMAIMTPQHQILVSWNMRRGWVGPLLNHVSGVVGAMPGLLRGCKIMCSACVMCVCNSYTHLAAVSLPFFVCTRHWCFIWHALDDCVVQF